MKIKKLIINDYLRFSVSKIKKITYTPKKKIQLILGTNGSGKSSMLREILPNVDDDKKHYGKNGYKELIIEHNGKEYKISYDRKTNVYSFKKDNLELNNTGQKRTQKILIEQEFKLDKNVYELLLGDKRFTDMSLGERKRWFTEILTQTDYQEALKIYDKVKDRIKELKAWVTLTQNKLIDIEKQQKDISEENMISWKKELNENKELIDKLLEFKYNIKQEIKLPKEELLNNLIKEYDRLYYNIKDLKRTEVLKNKEREQEKLIGFQKQLINIDKRLAEIEELKLLSLEDINELNENYNNIQKQIKEYSNLLKTNINIEIFNYIEQFKNRILDITALIDEIKKYKDLDTNANKINELKIRKDILNKQLLKLVNDIENINTKYSILKEKSIEEPVVCPKCGFKHIPNFNKKEMENVEKQLSILKERYKQTEIEYRKKEKEYEDLLTVLSYKKEFALLFINVKQNPILSYILKETDKLTKNLNLIDYLRTKFIYALDYNKAIEILTLKKSLENLNSEQVNKLLKKKEQIIDERIDIIKNIEETKYKLNTINSDLTKFERLKKITNDLNNYMTIIVKVKKNYKKKITNDFINNLVLDIKKVNTDLEVKINNYDKLEERRLILTNELEDYSSRLSASKTLEALLSPNKGIIGEYINKTINLIIERMNRIIASIWTYDLELLNTDIENGDLTFKFPVRISKSGIDNIIEDINKGSASMKEIINLAFKLVAMEFLNMINYPLILDEFGRTMDETHRIKAYDFIQEISKSNFSNIYIVSHFESMFSRFINTDVIILDKDNVNYTEELSDSVVKIKK